MTSRRLPATCCITLMSELRCTNEKQMKRIACRIEDKCSDKDFELSHKNSVTACDDRMHLGSHLHHTITIAT